MRYLPPTLTRLIEALIRLPSIGPKTAQRLAFHIVKAVPFKEVEELARSLIEVKTRIHFCKICNNITEEEVCQICKDESRDRSIVCVVEEASDLIAIEKAGRFRGVYHVLQGAISPLNGIGPNDLKIEQLIRRLDSGKIKEVVIATNADVEGDATTLYLADLIKPLGVRLTRLAHGIPAGGSLEYTDEVTLGRALEERREI